MEKNTGVINCQSGGNTVGDPMGISSNAAAELERQQQARTDVAAARVTGPRERTENAADERPTKKAKIDYKGGSGVEKYSEREKGSGNDHDSVVGGTAGSVTGTEMEEQNETNKNAQTHNDQEGDKKAERKETDDDDLHSTITKEDVPSGTAQDRTIGNIPISEEDDVKGEDLIEIDLNKVSDLRELQDDDLIARNIEGKNASNGKEYSDAKDFRLPGEASGIESDPSSKTETRASLNADEEGVVKEDTEERHEMPKSENDQVVQVDETDQSEPLSDSDDGTESQSSSESNEELDSSGYSDNSDSDVYNPPQVDDNNYLPVAREINFDEDGDNADVA